MEMMSSVADIICIAQITFKLIYNTLPANANFWTREYRLDWIADVAAKVFELFSSADLCSLKGSMTRTMFPSDVALFF